MIFAVLTLLLWTGASYSSSRAARLAGSLRANRWRLLIAAVPLLLLGPVWSSEPWLAGLGWFIASGVLHLGIGDMGLFAAYRRLGPRLSLLVCLCLTPPLAGLIEWWWLGSRPQLVEALLALVVVAAVAVALAPRERLRIAPGDWWPGIAAALLAAGGQALGAVVTRKGFALSPDAGAMETAFWRVFAGAMVLMVVAILWRRRDGHVSVDQRRPLTFWLILSVSLGPLVGIPCYQMALSQSPAALVQAVLAALPIMMIPVAWYLDGDRPSLRSLLGGMVAVSATAAMMTYPLW